MFSLSSWCQFTCGMLFSLTSDNVPRQIAADATVSSHEPAWTGRGTMRTINRIIPCGIHLTVHHLNRFSSRFAVSAVMSLTGRSFHQLGWPVRCPQHERPSRGRSSWSLSKRWGWGSCGKQQQWGFTGGLPWVGDSGWSLAEFRMVSCQSVVADRSPNRWGKSQADCDCGLRCPKLCHTRVSTGIFTTSDRCFQNRCQFHSRTPIVGSPRYKPVWNGHLMIQSQCFFMFFP